MHNYLVRSLQVQVLIYSVSAIYRLALTGYINRATEGVQVVMTQFYLCW